MVDTLQNRLQASLGGGYRIDRELSGGGMARLFVADEVALGRRVVVKVLTHELSTGVGLERFRREIQTLARLQHPNIVPILTVGELDGQPYFTMPYVEGESLRTAIARAGRLPLDTVIAILRDVTTALTHAHEQGVVHRDIKPDNVLLSGGIAMVTDFGVAKAILASGGLATSSVLTSIGVVVGTPAYMAPEQAAGDPNADDRADLYALGAMAYELLSGETPFGERTPHSLLAAHISERPVPLVSKRPDLPHRLANLVMRCLSKDRSDRPRSAKEVLIQLSASSLTARSWTQRARLTPRRAIAGTIVMAAIAAVISFGAWNNPTRVSGPESRDSWDRSSSTFTTDERLMRAIERYGAGQFEAVRALLEPITYPTYSQAVSADQRVTALQYLASMHAVSGNSDSAAVFFTAAMDFDPFFDLNPARFGAKEMEAFVRARERTFRLGIKPLTEMVLRTRTGEETPPVEYLRMMTSHRARLSVQIVSMSDSLARTTIYEGSNDGVRTWGWNRRLRDWLARDGDFEVRASATATSPVFSGVNRTATQRFRVRFGVDSAGSPITRLSPIP